MDEQYLDVGVRHDILMTSRGGGGLWGVRTICTYDETDPFAVTIHFRTQGVWVAWTFARDLLARGLDAPVGDGDVHVRPERVEDGLRVMSILLRSPDGELRLEAPEDQVRAFVDTTLAVVPIGTESDRLDLDRLVDLLTIS